MSNVINTIFGGWGSAEGSLEGCVQAASERPTQPTTETILVKSAHVFQQPSVDIIIAVLATRQGTKYTVLSAIVAGS